MSNGAPLSAALLCAAAAACCWRASAHPRPAQPASAYLLVCAAVLFTLSLTHALGWDLSLLRWGRWAAQDLGLYEVRRPLQALGLLVMLAGVLSILRRAKPLGAALTDRANDTVLRLNAALFRGCACATALIVLVFCMRTVSLHGIDALLAVRLQGLSLGRWLEASAALCICGLCGVHRLCRAARETPLKAWAPPRV